MRLQQAAANAAAVGNAIAAANAVPIKERYQLPQTTASITAAQIEQKINVVDTEDALKYMPSLFVRKRNAGDNQAVLASRVWGINSSARTLIYVDDILISNLQGNNNSNASPRWGLISPEEIKRIDFLYGPFAAMYPGNSMGGVLQITTRMPDKFETTLQAVGIVPDVQFYNTKDTYRTDQSAATDRQPLGRPLGLLQHQPADQQQPAARLGDRDRGGDCRAAGRHHRRHPAAQPHRRRRQRAGRDRSPAHRAAQR